MEATTQLCCKKYCLIRRGEGGEGKGENEYILATYLNIIMTEHRLKEMKNTQA